MAILGSFATSISAMIAQSHAFNNISTNIANINTGGYKATNTGFETVLSRTFTSGQGSSTLSGGTPTLDSGLGGVRANDLATISKQGNIVASDRTLDVAINGNGFFVLNAALDGSGEQIYTRDGAFDINTGEQFTVAGIPLADGTATTVTSNEGHLVDKNGFFVQGVPVNPDGTFTAGGALQPIRLDQFSFVEDFVPTSAAELVLNIPAGEAIILPQVDQFSLSGSFTVGDVASININGTTVSTAPIIAADTFQTIRDALVAAVNANATVGAAVTAAASATSGTDINITADELSISFTSFASTNLASPLKITKDAVQTAGIPDTVFSIDVVDSAGVEQNVRLDFAKSANNTWEIRTTTSRTPAAQVDTITLTGDIENTDTYSFNINGNVITYNVTGSEGGIDGVRNAIVDLINTSDSVRTTVTAAGTTAGEFTLTAITAGNAFAATASSGDPGTDQVDTLTLTGAFGDVGDVYTTTISGTAITVTTDGTEASLDAIRDKIVAAINADATASALVTAAPGIAGALTLTAATTGTPFTATAALTDVALGTVNTFILANTTTNSPADTATLVNTTANAPSSFTSAPTTLLFNGNGRIQTPTTLNITPTFNGGSTASVALDISGLTQFEGELTPVSYEAGGFAKAEITNFFFNAEGEISGKFSDGTTRAIYKVPLASFVNPNGLAQNTGNTFSVTGDSGTARIVSAGGDGVALLTPNAHELSNVDLASEFTKIIVAQKAYNSASKVFQTADELIQTARDLKR
jgi:flagellar hook protein FlgE